MTGETRPSYLGMILRQPVEAARQTVALGLSRQALWTAFGLVTVLNVILVTLHAHLLLALGGGGQLPPVVVEALLAARDQPLRLAAGQGALFLLSLHALHRVGRAFGGTGDLRGALQVMVLIIGVLSALMAAQLVATVLVPMLGLLVGIAFLVFLFWHLPGFVMGLHGFTNRFAVLIMTVVTFFAVEMVLTIAAAMVGVAIP